MRKRSSSHRARQVKHKIQHQSNPHKKVQNEIYDWNGNPGASLYNSTQEFIVQQFFLACAVDVPVDLWQRTDLVVQQCVDGQESPVRFFMLVMLFEDGGVKQRGGRRPSWSSALQDAFGTLRKDIDMFEEEHRHLFNFYKRAMFMCLRIICSAVYDEKELKTWVFFWAKVFISFGSSFFHWFTVDDFETENVIQQLMHLQQLSTVAEEDVRLFVICAQVYRSELKRFTLTVPEEPEEPKKPEEPEESEEDEGGTCYESFDPNDPYDMK